MEMEHNNFTLELSIPLEEQAVSFQNICMHIFSQSEFVDCTLCCSDGQLQAHRVILASASNYMHTMLSTTPWPTPCSHPMLFFKTFSVSDMKLALEFIYTGKAKVSKNKLPILMNIARELGCSSLTKAIEKAINSCGVEIFRKRIQNPTHISPSVPIKPPSTTTYLPITVPSFHSTLGFSQSTATSRNSRLSPHENKEASSLNEPHALRTDDTNQIGEETICQSEIKIEPGENMMLELDPSSIVTTTIDTPYANASQSPVFSAGLNNDSSTTQGGEEEANEASYEMHDIDSLIGMKMKNDKVPGKDTEGGANVHMLDSALHENLIENSDGDQIQDEDDEEMPITVVDLKSLADHGSEVETDVVAMSSNAIENTEALPANCPWCFQIFTSLTLLQRHIKTHVGNYKPYACQYCPASFARSAHLKRHIRTHTGEKPFVCTFCSRAFSRQDKLKTHLEKHLLDQQLQNNAKLNNTGGLSSLSQSNASLTRPNTSLKTSAPTQSTTTMVTGLSPHKQMMQGILSSTNASPCLPIPGYQYFLNEGPEIWQTKAATDQADRLPKGIIGVPGQITISTAITPSTTITPITLVHTNPTPPH